MNIDKDEMTDFIIEREENMSYNIKSKEKSVEKIENLIKKCDKCTLNECINCEISYTEVQEIKNFIKKYKELEEERDNYKEELEKIDKVLNLEAGRAAPYRNDIIEGLKRGIIQLKKIIDNSIPVSLVEETKKELHDNYISSNGDNFLKLKHQLEILQELLEKRK